ncbi:Stress response protein nst1, partial [Bienertia sinuspersici]
MRYTLESSVLLEIINLINPDIHVCMSKTDFLNLAPRTWLIGASIDASCYVFNRREEEKPRNPRRITSTSLLMREKKIEKIDSIIAEKEINLEKAKDNPHYDTLKDEWLKDKEKMTYRDSSFFSDKCRQSMSSWEKMFPITNIRHADLWVVFCKVSCKVIESSAMVMMVFTIGREGLFLLVGESKHLIMAYKKNLARCQHAIDFVSYKENRRKLEVLKDCALWPTTKLFLIQRQKRRKDKEKHLANLQAKRVDKLFLEDEKIREERARHEQE